MFDRRSLLKSLALATISVPFTKSALATPLKTNPFGLGVASGSPTDSSVVLWTRLYGTDFKVISDQINVNWEIAEDPSFKKLVQAGTSIAFSGLAYSVHVEAIGLEPNKWFYYRFQCGGYVSTVGKTRTLPSPNEAVKKLRLAYASCQNYEHGYFNAYKHMAEEQLDLLMFLGDYIYEYPPNKKAIRSVSGGWLINLNDYRERYAIYKLDNNLQSMHAACPWIMTWDDHEVQNDYSGSHAGSQGPAVSNFLERRAAAYQAYYEHMPLPASSLIEGVDGLFAGAELRIYGNFRFGKLANISMLDDRQYRDANACISSRAESSIFNPTECTEFSSSERTLLGWEQESWIAKTLQDKNRPQWNVIGQPTLYGQRYFGVGEKRIWNDGWDGFPAARKRLDRLFIENKVRNLVVFGGDVHQNWVGYIKENYDNPNSQILGVEFCGTSITADFGGNKNLNQILKNNPHFVFAEANNRGYGVAEFTNQGLTVTLRGVVDTKQEDSEIINLAKFYVNSGSSKIVRLN